MVVVIEGVDCAGKSTFAEMLSKKTGFEIVKGSSFEISELGSDGMFEHMMNLLDRENIIIDRFFFSNLVYGSIFDYPMMTEEQYDRLVDKLDEKAILLYLYAPESVIRHRMENRGDDMISTSDIKKILSSYKTELYGHYRASFTLSLDTTNTDFESETDYIKGFFERQ